MGVNHGHRRLQPRRRPASGSRTASCTYPVSEVTIAGTSASTCSRALTPANDLDSATAPTRRRCASRGSPLPGTDPPHCACASAGRAVREAGALALSTFRRRAQAAGPRARSSPVSRGRHRGRRFPARTAARDRARCGWLSEETEDDPRAARQHARLGGRSDRRHARLSRRLAGLDDLGRAGRATAGRCWPRCLRRSTDELSSPSSGEGATLQRRADRRRAPATASTARGSPGPKRCSNGSQRSSPASMRDAARHSLALRLARVAQGRLDAAFAAATATTGTLRPPIFWCTKPAGH